ncbi:hypothetical protein PVK06_027006 [Gossypium arboreum]|uniref:Uncharacterized protein n=1 Tax=Gossypium arboreum TaxID=29729 RepID=A0ABR0NZA1_GOSAR|nr:hypothetical protein PVK06_027006 [Gossypium arboreum]
MALYPQTPLKAVAALFIQMPLKSMTFSGALPTNAAKSFRLSRPFVFHRLSCVARNIVFQALQCHSENSSSSSGTAVENPATKDVVNILDINPASWT